MPLGASQGEQGMSAASRLLEQAAYVLDELGNGRLCLFGLEITAAKAASQRERNAFDLGVEAGARGYKPMPKPEPARVLQLVR